MKLTTLTSFLSALGQRSLEFLRWLWAGEELNEAENPLASNSAQPGPRVSLRWLLSSENLETAEPQRSETNSVRRPPGFLRWLFAPETLPFEAPAAKNPDRGLVSWLLAPEPLEALPGEDDRGQPGFFRHLLARETLLPHQEMEEKE